MKGIRLDEVSKYANMADHIISMENEKRIKNYRVDTRELCVAIGETLSKFIYHVDGFMETAPQLNRPMQHLEHYKSAIRTYFIIKPLRNIISGLIGTHHDGLFDTMDNISLDLHDDEEAEKGMGRLYCYCDGAGIYRHGIYWKYRD